MARIKTLRVNSARNHRQTFEPARGKLGQQGLGGDRGAVRKVMEGSEIAHDRLVKPAQSVVATVSVKICSEIRRDRQLQTTRRLQSRPTQGPFSRNVNDVGALQGPPPDQ